MRAGAPGLFLPLRHELGGALALQDLGRVGARGDVPLEHPRELLVVLLVDVAKQPGEPVSPVDADHQCKVPSTRRHPQRHRCSRGPARAHHGQPARGPRAESVDRHGHPQHDQA